MTVAPAPPDADVQSALTALLTSADGAFATDRALVVDGGGVFS